MSVDMGSAVGYLLLDTSDFREGFKTAFDDMKTFFDESTGAADKLTALSSAMSKTGSAMTKGLTLPLVGVAGAALKIGNSFEAQMSRVKGISGATEEEFKKLTDQAIELGAATSFSASEAAQGMENLASAGFTTNEIMEAMPGLLDLAASSGADLATSAEIAASAVRGFGLEASDTAHVADVFAEAAARTNAQTEDMGEAMKYIAPVANAMGQSLEMTAAAVGIMSDAGIKGSQAGTSLRGALSRLAKPTDVMQEKMDALGLSFYDAEGNMLPLTGIVEQLETKMAGLTQEQRNNALVTLFGQESLSGMLALMQRGSDELAAMTQSFEEVNGSASAMADTMLDNTSGALEELSGSIETLMIKIQQVMAPTFTSIIQKITEFVNSLSSMDESTLQTVVKIAAFAAALGPVLLIVGKIVGVVASVVGAITKVMGIITGLQLTVSGVIATIAGAALPIAAVIAAIVALAAAWNTNFGGMRDIITEFVTTVVDRFTVIFTTIQSIVSAGLSVLSELWNSNFLNIRMIVEQAFAAIETVFSSALTLITNLVSLFLNLFTGNWQGAWENIKAMFGAVWDAIGALLGLALDTILNTFIVIIPTLFQAATNAWNSIKNAFSQVWQSITDWFSEAINNPVETVESIGDALFTAGANIFTAMWDGIKSVWNKIVGWVSEAVEWLVDKVAFWEGESAKVNSNSIKAGTSIQGSFASGLNYVPRDMNVRVHEGEAILTKEENKERSGVGKLTVEVPLVINGKKFARAVAKDIDVELGKQRG